MENNTVPKDYDSLLAEYRSLKTAFDEKRCSGNIFVERIHYDFNTLLNSITGYLYSAYENADQAQKPAINGALKTSKLLLGKFNEMADYLSILFDGYSFKAAPSSLRLMLRQLNQEFDDAITTKSVKFSYEIDERIPEYIETDFNIIKKALSKLIENALQNTSSGTVGVTVSQVAENGGKLTLNFSVSDECENRRAEKALAFLTCTEESLGDGFKDFVLQAANDYLFLAGTSVTAKKNELKGLTISFLLNTETVATGSHTDAAEESLRSPEEKVLSGKTVLLADDSVIMQKIVSQMLENEGAGVTVASNGDEAVSLFKSSNADVVLLDIEMPVLNGYDAARLISSLKSESGIETPVIGMTAHTGQEEYDKCIESGMNRVVIKPFKYNDLMDAVFRELFGREYVAEPEKEAQKSSVYNFEKVKGIDYVEGVKRLGGNEKVYFELLQNFRNGYSDIESSISNLLKEGQDNEVKSLLHMMKGISGNLSFNEVYDYANKLKEAIEQDNIMDITKHLKLFGDAMREFTATFEAAEVEILYNMAELMDVDSYLLKTRVAEMMEYLTQDIDLGNAIDACDDIFDCIKESEEKKDFERIRDAVQSFDIELAAGLLKSFVSKYF